MILQSCTGQDQKGRLQKTIVLNESAVGEMSDIQDCSRGVLPPLAGSVC